MIGPPYREAFSEEEFKALRPGNIIQLIGFKNIDGPGKREAVYCYYLVLREYCDWDDSVQMTTIRRPLDINGNRDHVSYARYGILKWNAPKRIA